LSTIDFRSAVWKEFFLNETVTFVLTRSGELHGFLGFFVCHHAHGIMVDTAPSEEPTLFGQYYFPMRAITCMSGDAITVALTTSPSNNLAVPIMKFSVTIVRSGNTIYQGDHTFRELVH
jgi:hypothetical protein